MEPYSNQEPEPNPHTEPVLREKNDKPAAKWIWIIIVIAIILMAIYYFVFYDAPDTSMN